MRNHFEVFGLTPTFAVDAAALQERYLTLSKQVHPDRFVRAAPREKLQAMEATRELNDAYGVLRDRGKRAEYLLAQKGVDLHKVSVDGAMLMEMLERNEALVEALAADDDATVQRIVAETEAEKAATWRRIEETFALADWEIHLGELTQWIVALRYHARLLDQAEAPAHAPSLAG